MLYEFGEVEYRRLRMLKELEGVEKHAQNLLNTVQQIDGRLVEIQNAEKEIDYEQSSEGELANE